jgi:hypothetical protein
MNLNEEPRKIRAAIAVTPVDDPAKVAQVVTVFEPLLDFDLEVVGCATLSPFDLPIAGSAIGMPAPAFVLKQCIRDARTEISDLCSEVVSISDRNLSSDIKSKVSCLGGSLHKIIENLVTTFKLVIIPHNLNLTMKFGICRPVLDTSLVKSKKIPVLFYTDNSICRRIVILQIDSYIDLQAEQILRLLADSFDVSIYKWIPKQSIIDSVSPLEPIKKLSKITNSHELDIGSVFADQEDTLLAIPKSVIFGHFRYHKIRSQLSNWKGNFLILP